MTEDQWLAVQDIMRNALGRVIARDLFDEEQVARFLERENDDHRMEMAVTKLIGDCVRGGKHAAEAVEASDYVYPKKFGVAPKPVAEQIGILRRYFPKLVTYTGKAIDAKSSVYAEGKYVFPHWRTLGETYQQARELVMSHLMKQRKFCVHPSCSSFDFERQRRNARTEEMLDEVRGAQENADMLIVPAQFGKVHRGKSPRMITEELARTEFHLGVVEVGCMLLTHPERIQYGHAHWIVCAGDEFLPSISGGEIGEVSAFAVLDHLAGLYVAYAGNERRDFGTATGFLPEF